MKIIGDIALAVVALLSVLALIGAIQNRAKGAAGSNGAAVVAITVAALSVGGLAALNQHAASNTNPTVSQPTPSTSASPSESPAGAVVDPEANPTNTAPISTAGLKAPTTTGVLASHCRSGNPLANVYHPYRLQVVHACVTASGTVETVRKEDDGDYHIDVALDPAYRGMLDAGNVTYQHGWIVVEIVPADEPGCVVGQPPKPTSGTYNYGICTGADERAPGVGEHIWITGPYVIDHWHNWAEIHPAWWLGTSNPGGSVVAPRPTPAASATVRTTLRCTASVSDSSPAQYTTVDVFVRTSPNASVSATAHYLSKDTTNTAVADSSGSADVPFRISRATIGFQVVVDVSVSLGGTSASCSTSFTPS